MSQLRPTPRSDRSPASGSGEAAEGPWTVLRLIRWSAEYLAEKGVESPRLDAEHLLAHALGTTRLQLYLQFDRPLEAAELDLYRPLLKRRAAREPLQYIVGRAAFRELELRCDPRALIPRPETEILVDKVLAWARGRTELRAVDVGTGTGCIALSLLSEGPFAEVWGVDVSADALELARVNAASVPEGDRLHLLQGDGLSPLPDGLQVDVVVSNPPYVREDEAPGLQPEVRDHEPAGALFGGGDGLDVVRGLLRDAPGRLVPGGLLALEVGAEQGSEVAALAGEVRTLEAVAVHRDLAGRQRIVTAVRRGAGAAH